MIRFASNGVRQRPPAPVARPDKIDLRIKPDHNRARKLRTLFERGATDPEMMGAIGYTSIGGLRRALDKLGLRVMKRRK